MNNQEEFILQYYSGIITEISELKISFDFNQSEYIKQYGHPEDHSEHSEMMYELYSTHEGISYKSKKIFHKILYFLEIQGLNNFYTLFWNKFYNRMNVDSEIYRKTYIDEIDDSIYTLSYELSEMLLPFDYLEKKLKNQYPEENDKIQKIHLVYLERIISNISFEMNRKSFQPEKEKDLFDFVEPRLRVSFPETEKIQQFQFIKKLKSYIPDIFIPECKAIIELKFIKNNKDLISCIEAIDTDVIGYNGNSRYKKFYAVFYLKEAFVTPEEFSLLWKERKYPENWFGILNIEYNNKK